VAYAVYRVVVDEMHILNVAVAPAWRRRGLARWLLRFALDRAGRAGAIRALLEVRDGNAEARALYADMGFVRLGLRRDYYREPVEDAVVLGLEPVP
jgi:ribosomal-protein-alanine acetyltransferase